MNNIIELESCNLVEENIKLLKQMFPNILKDGKIDFDTLKLILGEEVDYNKESYKFEWNGKKNCYKTIQTQSIGTLKPLKVDSIDFDNTNNIIIEGDNLEVLKLLQSSYSNSIKMIYIDPPYNTGSDLVYSDDFKTPLKNYFEITGQTNNGENTQSKKSKEGRKHTQWLNMMFPRLLLSKTLLKEDGVVFISIDDYEYDNLKRLCDEVFGEENFRNTIIVKRGVKSVQSQFKDIDSLNIGHEYVLCYTKSTDYRFEHLKELLEDDFPEGSWNNHWRGSDRPTMRYELFGITPTTGQYRWSKDRSYNGIKNYNEFLKEINKKNNEVTQRDIDEWYFQKINELSLEKIDLLRENPNTGKPEHYISPKDYKLLSDMWTSIYSSNSSEMKKVFGKENIFSNPKPTNLLKRLMEFVSPSNDDYILDFFGGSGTTGHSVLEYNKEKKINLNFILIQLPEQIEDNKEQRIPYDFLVSINKPTNIVEITKERIRRVIKGYGNNPKPLKGGFKVFKLDKSNYVINEQLSVNSKTDRETLVKKLRQQFKTSTVHDESLVKGYNNIDIIYEIIIKEGYSLNSKIEELKLSNISIFKVTDNGKLFYITFDDVDLNITKDKEFMGISKDTLFVCFDNNLSDSTKDNLSLTFLLKTI